MGAFSLIVVINLLNRLMPVSVGKKKGRQSMALARCDGMKLGRCSRGRMYVGHLPFGFYDEALKKYFSQFGRVTKVRAERSMKTGGYKGYGFVEFENKEVAKIAAEATDNYIIDNKILVARYIS